MMQGPYRLAAGLGATLALSFLAAAASAQQWGPAVSVPVPPPTAQQPDASGPPPLPGIGYLGPARQALIGAGMSVPTADRAMFGGERTTCPGRAQSNDFSRNNPGVCDNY